MNLFPVPELPNGWKLCDVGTIKHPNMNLNGYLIKRKGRYLFVAADGGLVEISRKVVRRLI